MPKDLLQCVSRFTGKFIVSGSDHVPTHGNGLFHDLRHGEAT